MTSERALELLQGRNGKPQVWSVGGENFTGGIHSTEPIKVYISRRSLECIGKDGYLGCTDTTELLNPERVFESRGEALEYASKQLDRIRSTA